MNERYGVTYQTTNPGPWPLRIAVFFYTIFSIVLATGLTYTIKAINPSLFAPEPKVVASTETVTVTAAPIQNAAMVALEQPPTPVLPTTDSGEDSFIHTTFWGTGIENMQTADSTTADIFTQKVYDEDENLVFFEASTSPLAQRENGTLYYIKVINAANTDKYSVVSNEVAVLCRQAVFMMYNETSVTRGGACEPFNP